MALEQRPDMDVLVPLGDAVREMAGLIRAHVDAALEQPLMLPCCEGPVVADDVTHRIGHCLLLPARHAPARSRDSPRATSPSWSSTLPPSIGPRAPIELWHGGRFARSRQARTTRGGRGGP